MLEPKELLKLKLASSRVDAAAVNRKLAALKKQKVSADALTALRLVSRMYKEHNEVLRRQISSSMSRQIS
jgi:hypothetical protein